MAQKSALIVGAGPGLSASVARKCAQRGMAVALVARDTAKLAGLASEIGAARFANCNVWADNLLRATSLPSDTAASARSANFNFV